MAHYSRRPPPPIEPLALGTGDFEAVSYGGGPRSERPSNLSVPRPARAPIFHRSAANAEPQSQGYGFGQSTYPAHYSQAPAAPNSLSPMAMSSARGGGGNNNVNGTGPQQRIAETIVIRSRPTMRTGFSILLAGALIGGVIGITMRMRQNDADAAAALAAAAQHPEPPAAPSAPPPAPPAAPPPVATTSGAAVLPGSGNNPAPSALASNGPTFYFPPATVPSADPAKDKKRFGGGGAATVAPPRVSIGGGAASGGNHPSLSTKVTAPKEKAEKDDGYKEPKNPNDPPPVKEAKADKADKDPPTAKEPKEAREPKEAKEPKEPKKRGGGKNDDAEKVLRDAMGETKNTL